MEGHSSEHRGGDEETRFRYEGSGGNVHPQQQSQHHRRTSSMSFHFPGSYQTHGPTSSPGMPSTPTMTAAAETLMHSNNTAPNYPAPSPRSAAISMLATAASASSALGLDVAGPGQYSPGLTTGTTGGYSHGHPPASTTSSTFYEGSLAARGGGNMEHDPPSTSMYPPQHHSHHHNHQHSQHTQPSHPYPTHSPAPPLQHQPQQHQQAPYVAYSSTSEPKKKSTRRYNASCDACRARKRKCPGRDPQTGQTLCTACADRGVECTYGNLGEPSRLRRADNENEKMKNAIRDALDAGDLDEKDRILNSFLATEGGLNGTDGNSSSGNGPSKPGRKGSSATAAKKRRISSHNGAPAGIEATDPNNQFQPAPYSVTAHPGTPQTGSFDPLPRNSIPDPNGGRTGLALPAANSPNPPSSDGGGEATAQFTSNTIANADGDEDIHDRMLDFTRLVLPSGMMQGCPSPEDEEKMLSYYFCWLNPRYSLLDENLLRACRASGDQTFCTPFLMWSIYAHAAIHCPGFQESRKEYRARAHLLLGVELSKGRAASLTTTQGILLLAAAGAARGDHSIAWALTYTNVAFVNDLLESIDTVGPEEAMMRKRLYWSSYVWSLVMALNLNRRPPMPKLRVDLPEPTGNENPVWTPVLPVRAEDPPNLPSIIATPQANNEIACHHQACMLFTFLDDILSNVYMASHEQRHVDEIYRSVRNIRDRMIAWQRTIPPEIMLDPQNLPAICPPPHIAHFNLLLRSTWILLYRPFYNMASARTPIAEARPVCNECAKEIHSLFFLFERTFGVLRITFIYIYAAFWASTIDVAAAKREGLRPDLLARLRYSSRILLTWVSLPGMKQSVTDLIQQIESLLINDAPPPLPQPQGAPFSPFDPNLAAWQKAGQSSSSALGQFDGQNLLPQPKMEEPYGMPPPPLSMQHHQTMQGFNDPSYTASPAAYQPNGELYWTLPSWTMW